jgi:hypothetical protein
MARAVQHKRNDRARAAGAGDLDKLDGELRQVWKPAQHSFSPDFKRLNVFQTPV